MPRLFRCPKAALPIAALLLSGCATVSVADLSEPNFGYRQFPHLDASVNPDPMYIANGLYTPRALQDHSSQAQMNWGSWTP